MLDFTGPEPRVLREGAAPVGRGARPRARRARPASASSIEGDGGRPADASSSSEAAGLAEIDPEIAELLGRELDRQRGQIELIASENFTWPSVLEAVGSVPTNKYAEGYPGKRYYGGCEVVDEIEELARNRATELFGAEHANVQPHAGAQANMAVYFAVLKPGDRVLGLSLDHGGHLTHGLKVNFSGKLYEFHHYGVSRETMMVDYDEVLAQAKEVRPKLIVCGGSAYPRTVEAERFREIADEVGAMLMCDMAHFSGLVAAGLHPNPVPHCDFVTSTTHKTLAGPRAGFVLCREEYATKVDRANFPGMQGGPLMHTIAAKAACFKIAMTDAFRDYQRQVRANADALGAGLIDGGYDVLTGGTDTHLVQLDLRATEWTGLAAQERLEECKLTANRNTVPFDERPPMVASGVRLGTPAATMRGFDEADFREVASIIVDALHDDADVDALRGRAQALCDKRPLYPGFRGYTTTRTVRREPVIEVSHPLVQHKLSYLRDKDTPTVHFRKLVEEVTLLLTYEATKDLPTEDVEIDDAARARAVPAHLRQEGRGVPDPARRARHARRRAHADLGRARRLHRALPRRGDAAAGRVLREAAAGRRRPRRDPARPDARDRQLDGARRQARQGRRCVERAPDLDHRRARGDREHPRRPPGRADRRRGDRPRS